MWKVNNLIVLQFFFLSNMTNRCFSFLLFTYITDSNSLICKAFFCKALNFVNTVVTVVFEGFYIFFIIMLMKIRTENSRMLHLFLIPTLGMQTFAWPIHFI